MKTHGTAAVRTSVPAAGSHRRQWFRDGGALPAVDTAGSMILAFGDSSSDELGTAGWNSASSLPWTLLSAGTTIVDVAAGNFHGLAATDDGRLLAWGDNTSGQVGDGIHDPQDRPVEITIPGAAEIVARPGVH